MTPIARRDRRQRDPRPGRGAAELPLRAEPHAAPRPRRACASSSAPSVEITLELAARARRRRLAARAAPAGDRRPGVEPKQAWTPVAEFARAGPRRGQPRPRRDALRAPPRRAGRDRRARADLRGAAALRQRLAFRPCKSPPFSRRRARTRSCGSSEAKREAAEAGIELLDFGAGRPARADRPGSSGRRSSTRSTERMGYPQGRGPARAARGDRRRGAAAGSASTSTPTAR